MKVQFTIPGENVAQGRPRLTTVNGNARAFDPKKSKDYKNLVKMAAFEQMVGKGFMEGALSAVITVYKSIPKSFSKKKKEAAVNGDLLPTTKPDVDNHAKGVLDACNDIVYKDDSQIARLLVIKRYSDVPRTEVIIEKIQTGGFTKGNTNDFRTPK